MKNCPVCGADQAACGGPAEPRLSALSARPQIADAGPLKLYRVKGSVMLLSDFDAHRMHGEPVAAQEVTVASEEQQEPAPKRRGRPRKTEE